MCKLHIPNPNPETQKTGEVAAVVTGVFHPQTNLMCFQVLMPITPTEVGSVGMELEKARHFLNVAANAHLKGWGICWTTDLAAVVAENNTLMRAIELAEVTQQEQSNRIAELRRKLEAMSQFESLVAFIRQSMKEEGQHG